MNPAHSLGKGLRRLGIITGILHTRDENGERFRQHGGSLSDLTDRMTERAKEVEREVILREKLL